MIRGRAIANVLSLAMVKKASNKVEYSTGNGFTVFMLDNRSVTFNQSDKGLHYVTTEEIKSRLESDGEPDNARVMVVDTVKEQSIK